MPVVFNEDDHRAHQQGYTAATVPVPIPSVSTISAAAASSSTSSPANCLGSHRCRIYDIPRLLTDSRFMGSRAVYLELSSSSPDDILRFTCSLSEILSPVMSEPPRLTQINPHQIKMDQINITHTKLDPTPLLELSKHVLWIDVEKDTISTAPASNPSSDEDAAAAAAASMLSSAAPAGAKWGCRIVRSDNSPSATQLFLNYLTYEIASQTHQQQRLLRAMIRARHATNNNEDEGADDSQPAASKGTQRTLPPLVAGIDDDSLTVASFLSSGSTSTSSKRRSRATLSARVRLTLLQHEKRKAQLVEILKDQLESIDTIHMCNVCESILRIETRSGFSSGASERLSAASADASASTHRASSAAAAAHAASATPVASAQHSETGASRPSASISASPGNSNAGNAAASSSPADILARFRQLQLELSDASGVDNKLKRKKLNAKIREFREKYADVLTDV